MRLLPLSVLAAWVTFGLAQGLIRVASGLSARAVAGAFAFDVPLALLWAAWTPLIGWWDSRILRRTDAVLLRVLGHLPLLLALAAAHAGARRGLAVALGGSVSVSFTVTLVFFADVTVASYLAAAWIAHTIDAERHRVERKRRTSALRAALAVARIQYLDEQLRPHFLCNTLGAVSELAHEAPATAARALDNLKQLLKSGTGRDVRPRVSLDEELETLRPYLEIQRLRFPDWLTIEDEIDADARLALVPSFVLQPLVENALHHGLSGRTQRGRLRISARREGTRLRIDVSDDGVGLAHAEYRRRRGLGLENVRLRLAAVYGDGGTVSLLEPADGGTTARLEIPFEEHTAPSAHSSSEVDSGSGDPRRFGALLRWRGTQLVAGVIAAWVLVAAFRVQHSMVYLLQRDQLTAASMRDALRFDAGVASVWLLLTPLVLMVLGAVPLRRQALVLRAAFHLMMGVAIALAHAALTPLVLSGFDVGAWTGPLRELVAWNLAIYAILLVLWHLRGVLQWMEGRDAMDHQLIEELETARFHRTVLETRPEVLLAALTHAGELVRSDPGRAEVVLSDIGDFLRVVLDTMHERYVTVRDEAAAVAAYAQVLRAGAIPDLELRLSTPPELMSAPAPKGILRSLLDAAARDSGGSITIGLASGTAGLIAFARGAEPREAAASAERFDRLAVYARRGLIEVLHTSDALCVRIMPLEGADRPGHAEAARPLPLLVGAS